MNLQESTVTLAPWDYLDKAFNSTNFPDLFLPTWLSALVFLVVLVVLYNVRTRAFHHHAPYLDLYEWLLWTGIIVFGLLIIFSLFVWDFLFVVATWIIGGGVFLWIRFVHFPPMFEAYERKLARERYFTRTKFSKPEATIRSKPATRRRRRR